VQPSADIVDVGGADRRAVSPEEVGMNMPPGTSPDEPDDDARVDADEATTPAPSAAVAPTPPPPAQSREDTDVGWGEYRERDDDDRLLRDRPPHWDNG
jgi:hypothetical protein